MKNLVVILDAGHGKDTPGKCAPDKSLYEWQWTREIVAMLCERLYGLENMQTVILVPEEIDVPLKERVRRVNTIYHDAKIAGKECLLISIHINAAGHGTWKNASGWSVWVSNNASDKSKQFAQIAYREAVSMGLQGNRVVPEEQYWTSNFYILKNTPCPAVLTENLFQDNHDDVEFLKSDEGREKIVDLHFNAIKKYIEEC